MAIYLSPQSNLINISSQADYSTALHPSDSKVIQIKDRVMAVIRNYMPITTLFTPELKIDLRAFIEDQMLIQKIAAFLASLSSSSSTDAERIAQQFENSEFFSEIKASLQVPTPYLTLLYEACADVLNNKIFSNKLKSAIDGRVFTLKLALIAQNNPVIIASGQKQYQIALQEHTQIKEEGALFVRQCLRLHLSALQEISYSSFKEELTATAQQLIPFVQKLTKLYLTEKGVESPDNPLTFRNPTGYNFHGLSATTAMRAGLEALGYQTRMMWRGDLEPRVTLATKQSIIEVIAADQSKYIVDPSYIQFHKDICLDESQLPTAPVLVLAENEVDQYVEDNLMGPWKRNAEKVEGGDTVAINKLTKQDQIIPFTIHQIPLPPLLIPPNREQWVRDSLKRLWELRSFVPVFSNVGFQEIFTCKTSKTYEYVKAMGIGPLSHQLSFDEVEAQLNTLQASIKNKNSLEVLSLITQLPDDNKQKYASLLDIDPRVQGVNISLNAYFRSLKKLVNPEGLDKHVIYGCSGADCTSVMLATNAKFFTFVDVSPLSFSEFKATLQMLRDVTPWKLIEIENELQTNDLFISSRFQSGGATSRTYENGSHFMAKLALKLFYDLRSAGVNLKEVTLKPGQDKLSLFIEFPWQYYGESSTKKREITIISADVTKPEKYPSLLKKKIESGFDLFYMKAAFTVPQSYPQFLPYLAKFMHPGGWLMTIDKTFTMHEFSPNECLRLNGLLFIPQKTEEMNALEKMLYRPWDPFEMIPVLEGCPPSRRAFRSVGSDVSYWAILKLRQKSTES